MLLGHVRLDMNDHSQNKEKFPLNFLSNSKRFVLNARSEDSQQKWIIHLSRTCILNNYRQRYTNMKVLGKGTFAKVNSYLYLYSLLS